MKILILLIIPVSVLCKLSTKELRSDVEHLTSVLFANLERDPYLKNATFDQSKVFIDKQVANYMALMKKTHNVIEHSMTRRSLPIDKSTTLIKDNMGVYALDSMLALYSMNLQVPKDIHLFGHTDGENRDWYAAVLEDDLVIYKFKDESFKEVTRTSVRNGMKLGLTPLLDGTCIVVARNNSQDKAKIFHFVPKTQSLTKIQYLPAENASDVAIWTEHKKIFMVLAISMNNKNNSYEVQVPIYQWLGRHFDIVSYIKTYDAPKITPFIIGNSHFLAVANFQNNFGKTNIFSEILKYNRHLDKFESYQKISTNAAVDVKYFHLEGNYDHEHFLIFANLFEDDHGIRNYETNSIVYKYVEGYFIPFQSIKLNGVLEWLPVMGQKGEFALFAACKYDGIKIFQYNGWKFTESKLQYTDEAFSKGITSMRAYVIENKTLIVVANKNDRGSMTNIFELKFANKKMLNQFHDDNLSWCQENLKKYPLNRPKNNHTASKREVETNKVNEELSELSRKLKHYEDEVAVLEQQLRLALNSSEDNIIDGDLRTTTLTLDNTDTNIESLTTNFINNEDTYQFFESVININHDLVVENAFQLENVTTSEISPQYLNNHPARSMVYTNNDERLGEVIINGDVVFQKGLLLDGKLNGINFTKENVLLKQGNQSLSSLELNILAAELLDADFINDIDMSQINSIQSKPRVVEKIDTLNVKTAHIKGLINGVDVTKFKEYALRTSGAQTITGKYKFDSIYVDNFNSNNLSGKNLTEELVLIDKGEYVLEQAAEFVNALETDIVIISESLNHVSVVDGNLDILLLNTSEVQHVTGYKEFDEVELMNPIKLGGRITNTKIDQMNPVKITDEEITLTGEYIIKGDLQVEQFLQASEIQSASVSVTNLQSNGVKLADKKIPCHLQFLQQINVQQVSTDAINGVLIDSLVVMGTDNEQVITGWKTFPGDVFVTGATKLEYVNGIHIPTLESDVLRITGDQTITGNHQFENIVANRVFNVKTVFGERLWENVVTAQPDQSIPGTTVITGTLQLDELETDSLVLLPNSLINGYNFTFMIEDVVFRNDTLVINGPTEFKNIMIENLHADNLDLAVIPRTINESTVTYQLDDDFSFPSPISINEIHFTGSLNKMQSKDFENHWDGQIFRGDQTFNKVVIFKNLFVESGYLNDVNITRVGEDSIKTDEDYHFPTVTFTKGLESIYGITLDGQIESLDLNDVVLSHIQDTQTIVDEITLKSDVSINGEVVFNGLISGFNITEFCKFSYNKGGEGPRSLHINGNAFFVKGPEINSVNQVPIKRVLETAWFTTQDCTVSGEMEFDNIVFQEDVTVHGYVDDNKIQLIAHTYLSKTKNQNISAFYNFDDTVLFGNGIYAPRANVRGAIGEINLGEFVTTALLNNYEQVFENTVYLEDCEIREFLGEYSVNDLNLENDVMRYDQNNVVAGKKIVSDVKSYTMKIDKNVFVQNVGLIPWIHDSVLKSGTFHLQGKVHFFNETTFSKGISVQQNVNGMKFNQDTIMLKSKPQTITATKRFIGNENQTIKFQSLNSKGLINGVDMNNLMQQQAYKNREVIFESPIYFNGSIVTPNMHVEKLYQGVNVSDLIRNITQFSSNHNYTENFERLLQVSYEVKGSLQTHAYFVNYYKVKQMYQNIDIVIPVSFPNDKHQYLACITKENHKYTIKFEVWDSDAEHFHKAVDISPISAPSNLRYIKEIKFRGADHWYIEHEKTTLRAMYDKYEGSIFEITRSGLKQIVPAILHNGTKYVSSIDLPILNKCVFLLFTSKAFIYCQSLIASSSSSKYWNPFQEIETFNSVEGTVASVNNITYIFILNAGTLNGPSSVDVWKFDTSTKLFQKEQSIYVPYPTSITTICYKNVNFFAVATGYMQNSKYEGIIVIRKYDPLKQHFVKWQDIQLNVPMQVLFAELPTRELILYVSTNNPTQPLIMYQYEGISKFTKKIVATTIPPSSFIKSFNTPDLKHFVLAQAGNETSIIEAVFKGQHKLVG